jgi:hypothetical protein
MTPEQQHLMSRLDTLAEHHRWCYESARVFITAGPKTFDAWCSDGARTLWHWVGTADDITAAVAGWIEQRQTRKTTTEVCRASSTITP